MEKGYSYQDRINLSNVFYGAFMQVWLEFAIKKGRPLLAASRS